MEMICEKCGSKMLIKYKHKQVSGRTYHRFRCKNEQCLHRTTAYTGRITRPNHKTGSCRDCIHWIDSHCSMDFPEAIKGNFAPLCSCYMKTQTELVSDGISRSGSATKMETLVAEL